MAHYFSDTRVFRLSASALLGFLSLIFLLSEITVLSSAAIAGEPVQPPSSGATQRLMKMFSPTIRAVLNACQSQGGVNLGAGASQDGTVVCGNGSFVPQVSYESYISTTSDLLAASSLVGLRAVIVANPTINPEQIVSALSSAEGLAALRRSVQQAIAQTGLASEDSATSSARLTNEIMGRLLPTIQRTNNLQNLLGTTAQYNQTVSAFCTAPGMSVEQAQQTVSGLSSVQLYAICVQESGLADELLRTVR